MKKYNTYTYISPIGIVSEVKRRLNKYFASNQLDESMIGLHIENCIRKLGVGVLDKTYAILDFSNFRSSLPDDFYKLNIAYKCNSSQEGPNDWSTNMIVNGYFRKNIKCTSCEYSCPPDTETFESLRIQVPGINLNKIEFRNPELLYVGVSKDKCIDGCQNFNTSSKNEIAINGKTVSSNFEHGFVFLSYYTMGIDVDGTGYPLIPDEVWMTEYVKSYLYYQFYEDLFNDITDETANQIAQKRQTYQQEYFEKLVIAQAMAIAPTKMQILDIIKKTRNRLNPYNIKN